MRLVWQFGDGSVMYTLVDPALRLPKETEAQQLVRVKERTGPMLRVSNIRRDHTIMTNAEYADYVKQLGDGALATFVGTISDEAFMSAFDGARDFRGAWRHGGSGISVDLAIAKEIKCTQLRNARAPLLKEADVAFSKALESGDKAAQAAVAATKQALRDVTDDPAIEAATTIEELRAVQPAVLKE